MTFRTARPGQDHQQADGDNVYAIHWKRITPGFLMG